MKTELSSLYHLVNSAAVFNRVIFQLQNTKYVPKVLSFIIRSPADEISEAEICVNAFVLHKVDSVSVVLKKTPKT